MLELVFRALQGFAVIFMVGGLVVILWQVSRPSKPPIAAERIETMPVSAPLPSP